MSRDNSVGAGKLWFDSHQRQKIVLFAIASKLAQRSKHFHNRWVPRILSSRETDHSLHQHLMLRMHGFSPQSPSYSTSACFHDIGPTFLSIFIILSRNIIYVTVDGVWIGE
jgi:hypothetical protein